MIRVALNPGGSAVLYRDQNSARVGTIVRTRGVDDFLHNSFDYTVLSEGRLKAAQ
jgi:hypothetical protein